MKKIIRSLILVGLLAIVVFVGKSKWTEFSESAASGRYSHSSYKKVTHYFRKALKMLPFASGHYVLADSYLDEGLEDQAVEEYKKTLQVDARFTPAYSALANIYLRKESYGEALELVRKAEVAMPDNPDIKELKKRVSFEYFRDAGVKAFEAGDRLKARELLNNALEADPDSAQAHYLIALSFDERQDFYRVEDHLKEAIRLAPKFYLARSFLGDVYFGKGDFEAAIEQYQSSLAIKSDDPSVLNNIGLAYMNLERYGSAIPNLEKACAFDPANIGIGHNLAVLYRDYGMLDKAAEGFIRIVHRRPDYPNVHNDLGDIYRKQGRDPEALKEYRAAIEHGQKRLSRSSRDPSLLVELAYAYSEIKEYERAEKLIDEALTMNPNDQRAYLTLANIYRSSGRSEDALVALGKAKKLSSQKYLFIEEAISDVKEQLAKEKQAGLLPG